MSDFLFFSNCWLPLQKNSEPAPCVSAMTRYIETQYHAGVCVLGINRRFYFVISRDHGTNCCTAPSLLARHAGLPMLPCQ
jgi:hypothetical protein